MSTYSIPEILQSTDRYKLYTMLCGKEQLTASIQWLHGHQIPTLNVGKELAIYIQGLANYRFLHLDVIDYALNLFNRTQAKVSQPGNDVLAIHNLGILFEPALQINASQMLKDYSKTSALIIVWENSADLPERLFWLTQQKDIFFDFTETPLKKMQYAI
jgi:hypothetical protein